MTKLKIGDVVESAIDNHASTYIYTGKVGNKFRLVVPGLPNVTVLVTKDKITKIGPWR